MGDAVLVLGNGGLLRGALTRDIEDRFQVLQATERADATRLVAKGSISALVVDCETKSLSAVLSWLATLRDRQPAVRAVIVVEAALATRVVCERGVDAVVTKPFDRGDVLRALA